MRRTLLPPALLALACCLPACLLLGALPAGPATARTLAAPSGNLVFADEFNAASIDTAVWTALNRPGDASNSEQQCYLPSNAAQAGGVLTITDRTDTSCSGFSYTSAMVQTKSYAFTYGTFEVRAQMPRGGGEWPALWLLGANCQGTNPTSADNSGACQWPTTGSDELDMWEGKGQTPSQGFFNLNKGTAPNNDNQAFGCNNVPLPFDTSAGMHTYDLVWAPGSLTWQVDGATYCTHTANVPNTAMFILLNVALGGFAGVLDPSVLPQSMAVDYVRVYQAAVGTPTPTNTTGAATATRTATRTPTATATPGTTLGYTTATGGSLDTGDGNALNAVQVHTGAAGATVTSLSAYVGPLDSTRQYGLAVYTDSAGAPGTLVAGVTGTLSGANGWNSLPLAASLAPNTSYWLAYNTNTASQTLNTLYMVGSGAKGGWSTGAVPCCAFPASTAFTTMAGHQYSIYASLGGPVPTATSTSTPVPPTSTPTATGTSTSTATPSSTPTATLVPSDTPTSTQTPAPLDTATASATASDTAIPSDTPTPAGVLGPYGCLYPGVLYQWHSSLTDSSGTVVYRSPEPTYYTVDAASGPACTPGG